MLPRKCIYFHLFIDQFFFLRRRSCWRSRSIITTARSLISPANYLWTFNLTCYHLAPSPSSFLHRRVPLRLIKAPDDLLPRHKAGFYDLSGLPLSSRLALQFLIPLLIPQKKCTIKSSARSADWWLAGMPVKPVAEGRRHLGHAAYLV